MREIVKNLNKYITNYCLAHSDMIEAQHQYTTMRTTKTILKYFEAEKRFNKAQTGLKNKLPPTASLSETINVFLEIVQEAQIDSSDHE